MKRRRNSRCGTYLTSQREALRWSRVKVVYESSSDSDKDFVTGDKPKEGFIAVSFDPQTISTRSSATQTTYTSTSTKANLESPTTTNPANHIRVCCSLRP